jgi:uncharacterized GH25 family protein
VKTGSGISRPILFLGTAAVVLALFLLWFGLRRNKPTPAAAEPEVVADASSSANETPAAVSPTLPTPVVRTDGEMPPVIPISLSGIITQAENDQWDKSAVFRVMPRGTQSFGGIEFWVEGALQLQSKSSLDEKKQYREKIVVPLAQTNFVGGGIEIVQSGSNVGSVYLLGATRYTGEGECTVASLVWRYLDGTTRRTPIQFENHVRDWIRMPYETPSYLPYAFSKVAWYTSITNQAGRVVRLYRFAYANPEPAKTVRQLELASAMASPNLFLVGLSLDPLKLGERPDDSPNLEPTDPWPPSQLDVFVQNSEGQPIPHANLRVVIQPVGGKSQTRMDRTVKADANGYARVNYPPIMEVERLDIGASHDDCGARKMVWETKAGDIIPASFVIKLGGGIGIGGTVVDSSDNPIVDAKVQLSRFWTGGEEMNKRGEQSDFSSRTLATDSQGRWQAKGVPADLLNRISVSASHPDYVSTRLTVSENATVETKLRDGTHRIVLQQGLLVPGRVTDDQDNPISDARVWAGMANFSGTQDTKTDAQGQFTFRNLKEGEMQFSVLAKGRKPESKKIIIKQGMAEIRFRLGPGQVVRGLVKNETGEPVPGVRVALESPSGGVSQDYQFETTTDDGGRFEWDGAPDEARNFCFLKTGYEAKRRQTLKLDGENVITLRKGRKVQGWVLDAQTEKPIAKFRVGTARSYNSDSFYPDYPGMKTIADVNGAFSFELNEEETSGIKAVADDYAEQVEKLPEAQNGVVQVVLRLKPSASLRGVVTAEGVPVPGATVALTTGNGPTGGVSFRNGRFEDFGRGKVVTTDAAGEFVISSPSETGTVLAVAEYGFASAPIQQVRESGRLALQAFGRIEGTFKVAGQPVAGQEFLFSMMNVGISFDFAGYKATTDEAGRFIINKVPPGAGQVVRLVKTSGNSWMHSHNTDVAVEPGQTTHIALGDTGAVLKGHVSFETPPGEGESLTISGNLSTSMPERPPNFATAEEARAFFDSPEWKEKMKQRKNYSVSVNADGTLALDSIPPGNYTLSLNASKTGSRPWENPTVAQGSINVVVPENASPLSPIAIEEIVLKPTPKPGVAK